MKFAAIIEYGYDKTKVKALHLRIPGHVNNGSGMM